MTRVLAAVLGLLAASRALASGGGTSGAEFLRVGMGARAAGLGENFTGLADDVTAAAWNPAGLGRLERIEFSGMHFASLGDVSYEFIAASYPFGGWGSLAVSAVYAGSPAFDSTAPGSGEASASASDMSGALSWVGTFARLAPASAELKNVYYGATARVIARTLGGYTPAGGAAQTLNATGFAADAGLLYQASRVLSVGVSALNLGTPIGFLGDEEDALPVTLRAGAGWTALDLPKFRAVLLADVARPVDPDGGTFAHGTWGGAGVEATLFRLLVLRGGFRSGADGARVVGGAGVAFALGGMHLGLDGAIVPLGDFGTGWRAGLTLKMGESARPLPAPGGVTADSAAGKRVLIRWLPAHGASGYHVEIRTPGAAGYRRLTKAPRTAPELAIALKGQKPGAEYAFRVLAVGDGGREGAPAEVLWRAPRPRALALPPTPGPINARVLKGRRLALAWAPVPGAKGYNLFIKRGPAAKWKKITKVPRAGTSIVLKGMKPGAFTIAVAAVNAEGKQGKAKARPIRIK